MYSRSAIETCVVAARTCADECEHYAAHHTTSVSAWSSSPVTRLKSVARETAVAQRLLDPAAELESARRRPSSSMASAWTSPGAISRRSCGRASQQPDRPAWPAEAERDDRSTPARSVAAPLRNFRGRGSAPPIRAGSTPCGYSWSTGRRAEPDREDGPRPARHVSATPPPAWRGRRRRGLRATGCRCRMRRGGAGR
jgi:hypothetical protein